MYICVPLKFGPLRNALTAIVEGFSGERYLPKGEVKAKTWLKVKNETDDAVVVAGKGNKVSNEKQQHIHATKSEMEIASGAKAIEDTKQCNERTES